MFLFEMVYSYEIKISKLLDTLILKLLYNKTIKFSHININKLILNHCP